jgi:hypothetical protein
MMMYRWMRRRWRWNFGDGRRSIIGDGGGVGKES